RQHPTYFPFPNRPWLWRSTLPKIGYLQPRQAHFYFPHWLLPCHNHKLFSNQGKSYTSLILRCQHAPVLNPVKALASTGTSLSFSHDDTVSPYWIAPLTRHLSSPPLPTMVAVAMAAAAATWCHSVIDIKSASCRCLVDLFNLFILAVCRVEKPGRDGNLSRFHHE
ncbi:unnamed protein product, partial [Linum tenue]